jgi:hypothetical protein
MRPITGWVNNMPWTPYIVQIKIALIVLAVAGLFGSGVWLRGVFAERAALRLSETQARATAQMYTDAWNRNEQLQKGIVDAVKNIWVQSNNYISAVESDPPPVVPDGGTIMLVAAGVPKTATSLSGFKNNSSGRTSAAAAGH